MQSNKIIPLNVLVNDLIKLGCLHPEAKPSMVFCDKFSIDFANKMHPMSWEVPFLLQSQSSGFVLSDEYGLISTAVTH